MAILLKRRKTPMPDLNVAVDEVLPSDLVEDEPEFEEEPTLEVYNPDDYDPDKLPEYIIYEPIDYRDGPEGFIKWCEDNVWVPIYPDGSDIAVWTALGNLDISIHPKSGKSYSHIWEMQKVECRKFLRMVQGRFIYRLIILSWMRGEGKSLLAVLVQLWKFFNWPKQQIVLGANSKDQVKFVHYEVMKDIIVNSPELHKIIGDKNIQEKEIRLRDSSGNITSVLKPLSSFTGIVSNITGYTFSEMFDMKNPKFFTQLDGSMRNVPNALGVIDSTVSVKTHVLYKMYQAFTNKTTKTLFFSYRCSKDADIKDYWNPNMDQQQLDDYRAKFPLGDFERYFMNVWSSNAEKVFTAEMLECMGIIGIDGHLTPGVVLLEAMARKLKIRNSIDDMMAKGAPHAFEFELSEIRKIDKSLWHIKEIYKLKDAFGQSRCATLEELMSLGELYDTNWAILAGIDRADPLKSDRTAARTIVSIIAKGLPGSKSNPNMADDGNPQYLYITLDLAHIADSLLEGIKHVILEAHEVYDGVDAICGERWGIWDMSPWCDEHEIAFEPIHPSYDKQKAAFSELHGAISTCRFKMAPIAVWGSAEEDIFKEEAAIFFHDEDKRWFGSPEKSEKYGVQDDTMFSVAWAVYGGRDIRADQFKERGGDANFGLMVMNRSLLTSNMKR